MALTIEIPGLPGGPLTVGYPIRLNLIPAGNTYQRPGIKARSPRRSVCHGTGNPTNASAWAEAQYFVNGAEGRQASVHACIDDREVVICVPLDEVTWQAADGNGPGNMNGLSCEMMEATAIWSDAARRGRLIAITADFMGRVAARFDIAIPEQHWDFNAGDPDRHDCPNKLRHVPFAWKSYTDRWYAAKIDEEMRMGGAQPTPGIDYPAGMDEEIATWLFSDSTADYSFNPKGPVSQAWLTYGKARGYTRLVAVRKFDDGREYFEFGNMTLWRPNAKTAFRPLGGA